MQTKPLGRVPRVNGDAPERTITVRLSGSTHARLCELREIRGRSINKLVVDAIHKSLPLPIVAAPTNDPAVTSGDETQP